MLRAVLVAVLIAEGAVLLFRFVDPPVTPTMLGAWLREGSYTYDFVPLEDISPHFVHGVMAAEDARFCSHWGFDTGAIRAALADGASRGASTISQQTAKNLFLWQGRSWVKKGLEAVLTLPIEAQWPKRRILEVYLNIVQTGPTAFGAEAGARYWFGTDAGSLGRAQAAAIAAILPNPIVRSAHRPGRLAARVRREMGDIAAAHAACLSL